MPTDHNTRDHINDQHCQRPKTLLLRNLCPKRPTPSHVLPPKEGLESVPQTWAESSAIKSLKLHILNHILQQVDDINPTIPLRGCALPSWR